MAQFSGPFRIILIYSTFWIQQGVLIISMELTQVYSDSIGFIQALAENVEVELKLGDGCFVVDVLNKLIEGKL